MKIRVLIFISLASLVFSGASPWEGAAAIAPDGELPASGFYVATNSFPRNTVVDITNIETNRSTRVIVAAGLNSPGLLAIISREAAEAVGMRPGSISRIRMTQPSDPIAYLRFTDGLAAGIPPFDSGNVITEELYRLGETRIPDPPASANGGSTIPPYILEPEWGGRSTRNIIDLPDAPVLPWVLPEAAQTAPVEEQPQVAEAVSAEEDEPVQVAEAPIEAPAGEEEVPPEVAEAPIEEEESAQVAEAPHEEDEAPPVQVVEAPTEEEEPAQVAEAPHEAVPPQVVEAPQREEYPAQVAEAPQAAAQTQTAGPVPFNIVPSQERPPQTIYGIDPSLIIPGISRTRREPEIPASDIVPAVTRPQTETAAPAVETAPVAESVPVVESVPAPVAETASAAPAPDADVSFSVPRIYELAKGSYYVQLAAADTPESAESAVRLIDRSYGPVVYKDGDNWYRVLLGPLNQGESAAVLQRFRSIGYKDAFVRQGR